MKKVGIIGGGLGGLAAACVLAARGYHVTIFERNKLPGDECVALTGNGFRFDMGSSILLMPSILERIFAEAGRRMTDELDLVRLDPQWRSFFDNGSIFDLNADLELNSAVDRSPGIDPSNGSRELRQRAERLHRITKRCFFWRPAGGLKEMIDLPVEFQPDFVRDLLAISRNEIVSRVVRTHLSDRRVVQMIDHFTQSSASDSEVSPEVSCGISYMQAKEGLWYPRGGGATILRALTKLARSLGIEIRSNTGVERILSSRGQVIGLKLRGGESFKADAVVSNSDSHRSYWELLGGSPPRSFAKRRQNEPVCSGLVLNLGLKQRYEHLLHNNFVFSRNPEEEFEAIYRRGELALDPTCYVCSPSATDPSVAPSGGDALYVLVHTPFLRPDQDWTRQLPDYRRLILEKLKRTAGMEDIESRIVTEQSLTPLEIGQRYAILSGAIYGLDANGRSLNAFKPGNRSPDVRGLYLAGGGTDAGPGMPMLLMSGLIAADALDRDAGRRSNQQLVNSATNDERASNGNGYGNTVDSRSRSYEDILF